VIGFQLVILLDKYPCGTDSELPKGSKNAWFLPLLR